MADAPQPHFAKGIGDVVDAAAGKALMIAVQHHEKVEMRTAGDAVLAFDDEAQVAGEQVALAGAATQRAEEACYCLVCGIGVAEVLPSGTEGKVDA